MLTVLGVISVILIIAVILPFLWVSLEDVDVHVSTDGFSLVPNVDFSFPCRNWFPRKNGILFMLSGNFTWLRTVFFSQSGEMLCVEQLCSEALPWNGFCWVFSVVRVRQSSMHISMDIGKCPICSILSLLRNFAVNSSADRVLKSAMVKTVIPCSFAVISSTDLVQCGSLSKASFRSIGSKDILSFFLTV